MGKMFIDGLSVSVLFYKNSNRKGGQMDSSVKPISFKIRELN